MFPGGLFVPSLVKKKLFSYQRTGLRGMWELYKEDSDGIVGDEMGLGKTVQVSAFLGAMTAIWLVQKDFQLMIAGDIGVFGYS
jgi:DNA excision repair protein ERCC-6